MRSVAPEFSITGVVHVPVLRLIEDNATGATWSGAVVRAPLAGEIRASLIVAARAYARLMISRCGPP